MQANSVRFNVAAVKSAFLSPAIVKSTAAEGSAEVGAFGQASSLGFLLVLVFPHPRAHTKWIDSACML